MTQNDRIFIVKLFRIALEFIAAMPFDRELKIPYGQSLAVGFKEQTDELLANLK